MGVTRVSVDSCEQCTDGAWALPGTHKAAVGIVKHCAGSMSRAQRRLVAPDRGSSFFRLVAEMSCVLFAENQKIQNEIDTADFAD